MLPKFDPLKRSFKKKKKKLSTCSLLFWDSRLVEFAALIKPRWIMTPLCAWRVIALQVDEYDATFGWIDYSTPSFHSPFVSHSFDTVMQANTRLLGLAFCALTCGWQNATLSHLLLETVKNEDWPKIVKLKCLFFYRRAFHWREDLKPFVSSR